VQSRTPATFHSHFEVKRIVKKRILGMQNVLCGAGIDTKQVFSAQFFVEHLSCPFNLMFVLNLGFQTTIKSIWTLQIKNNEPGPSNEISHCFFQSSVSKLVQRNIIVKNHQPNLFISGHQH
jgi:hypothetical protein